MPLNESQFLLAKYDISGIQDYIFSTNLLRENAGASYHVSRILEEYLPDALWQTGPVFTDWKQADGLSIQKNKELKAEIIYIGGGNAMVLFRDEAAYNETSRLLARRVMKKCEGLTVVAACIPTELKDFSNDYDKLSQKLAYVKQHTVRTLPFSPFPVVEQDSMYGLPVTEAYNPDRRRENMTAPRYQKQKAYREMGRKTGFYQYIPKTYDYAIEMEDLGREKGDDSYVAVIHIDGNGMGDSVRSRLGRKMGSYEEAVSEFRHFSMRITGLFWDVYGAVVENVLEHKEYIKEQEGAGLLMLRPLILDGDDLTLICTAELGLPFAAGFLKELMKRRQDELAGITACAGIAFVHNHFPFQIAYSIAEKCCSNAKRKWYGQKMNQGQCWLDFQVIQDVGLERIRHPKAELAYRKEDKKLRARPYVISCQADKAVNALESLCGVLSRAGNWPKNRLQRLYQAYLEGAEPVRLLEKEYESRGHRLSELADETLEGGFDKEGNTPLYDALEVLDLCPAELLEEFLCTEMRGT